MTAEARPVPIDGFAGVRLEAPGGKLAAVVVPSLAMLCCSLTHRGTELLGQRGGAKAYAETGSTMGIPLLHPWANRLSDLAAAGVRTPAGSDLLRIDGATGLPIHGLRLRGASWTSTTATGAGRAVVTGDLDLADEPELAAAFPFPHRLRVRYALDDRGLEVRTAVVATGDVPVPVALGFHPYLAPPGPREEWVLTAAVGERLELDERLLPTGSAVPAEAVDGPLADRALDDGFTVVPPRTLAVEGGGRRLEIALDAGFPFAQIFAPPGQRLVALEPMTAPTDALVSRRHLAAAPPGGRFEATFRVNVR